MRENIELTIISYIHANSGVSDISKLLTIDPDLFLKHKSFYNKVVSLYTGKLKDCDFDDEEFSFLADSKNIVPTKSDDVLIEELKKNYVEKTIKSSTINSIEDLEALVSKVNSVQDVNENPKVIHSAAEAIEERYSSKEHCVKTGISALDTICPSGLKGGHMWVIGAYTNVGKTTLALALALRVAREHRSFFYSLEMRKVDLVNRMIYMKEADGLDEGTAADYVASLKMEIYTTKTSIDQIEAHLITQQDRPKIVFIDFVQNIEGQGRGEYEISTRIARRLQKLALRLNICIVCLSQLSNDSVNNDTRTMGFKGSGAWAAVCDVGIELGRDKEETTEIVPFRVWVRKNRHGRTGMIEYEFDKTRNKLMLD